MSIIDIHGYHKNPWISIPHDWHATERRERRGRARKSRRMRDGRPSSSWGISCTLLLLVAWQWHLLHISSLFMYLPLQSISIRPIGLLFNTIYWFSVLCPSPNRALLGKVHFRVDTSNVDPAGLLTINRRIIIPQISYTCR